MPARKTPNVSRPASRSDSSRSKQFEQIGKSTSQIVRDAAALLDEEVAAGIVAARQMQKRFQKERRIDSADFREALQKFQGDAHEIVSLLNEQLSESRSKENTELVKRLLSHTHDVVDLVVEITNTGAELANQLAQSGKKNGVRGGKRAG